MPPEATGADTVAQFGMDAGAILETRTRLITMGPYFDDLGEALELPFQSDRPGWSCVSGRACNVSDLLSFRVLSLLAL